MVDDKDTRSYVMVEFTEQGMSLDIHNVSGFQVVGAARILEMEGSVIYANEKRMAMQAASNGLVVARGLPQGVVDA